VKFFNFHFFFKKKKNKSSSFPYPDLSSMQKSHSLSSIERTNLLRKNDSTLLRSNSSLLSDPATSGVNNHFFKLIIVFFQKITIIMIMIIGT